MCPAVVDGCGNDGIGGTLCLPGIREYADDVAFLESEAEGTVLGDERVHTEIVLCLVGGQSPLGVPLGLFGGIEVFLEEFGILQGRLHAEDSRCRKEDTSDGMIEHIAPVLVRRGPDGIIGDACGLALCGVL